MIIGGMYTIDFTRVSKIPKFEINIKNGDSKRIIRLILLETGVAINLNNYTVTVAAKKSDGTNIFNHVEIIDALYGICEVEITEQMLALDMDLPCEIVLYSHDGVVASSSNFVLSIISSVRNEESIVSSNEFSALTKALSDVTYLKSNLNKKMNKDDSILVSQINKNAGKLDETYMSDEFLKQITGKSPLSSV
ncbi:BppU family phage baseplate upper protein, partial [Paraclostridium sordellii]|uniref:BppU family phage baseplate upper protein n=1 Tax=Paraclostridium sordellii TaxID=1505 RepID=UPI000A9A7AB4